MSDPTTEGTDAPQTKSSPSSSDRHLAEHSESVPDLLPTQRENNSSTVSVDKGSEKSPITSELGEKVRLSDEVDENGRQFELTPKREFEFGVIDDKSGLTPAPILFSEGLITNPATNDEYSLVHIEARHGGQIRKAGYKSVLEFIEHVAKNYERIREGNVRNDNPTYMLQLKDKHNNTLIVELSLDGNYWNINTAGIFKDSYGKNRKEVYRRHTTAKQPAETVGASQEVEQSGTQTSSRMNVPTSSQNDAALQTAAFQPHGDNTNSPESKDREKSPITSELGEKVRLSDKKGNGRQDRTSATEQCRFDWLFAF